MSPVLPDNPAVGEAKALQAALTKIQEVRNHVQGIGNKLIFHTPSLFLFQVHNHLYFITVYYAKFFTQTMRGDTLKDK